MKLKEGFKILTMGISLRKQKGRTAQRKKFTN